MSTISLFGILYEGLLKIPPKLSAEVKKDAAGIMAAKYYVIAKKLYNDRVELSKQMSEDKKHFESISDKLAKKVSVLGKELQKIEIKDQDYETSVTRPIELDKSLQFAIYRNTLDRDIVTRITLKTYMSSDSDERVIDMKYLNSLGEEVAEATEIHSLEEQVKNYIDYLVDYDKDFESIKDYREESASLIDHLDSLRTSQNQLTNTIGDNYEKAINQWGFNRNYRLFLDMFQGWNPGSKPIDLSKVLKSTNEAPVSLYVKFVFQKENEILENQGHYSGRVSVNFYSINIVIPFIPDNNLSTHKFDEVLDDVYSTIDHELGHLVQDLLQHAVTGYSRKTERGTYGYPSKKISQKTPEISPEGKWSEKHEVRDIEFYTRLGDSKVRAEKILANKKRDTLKTKLDVFKVIVGLQAPYNSRYHAEFYQDPWFAVLKKENPGKWSKAVKELYKSLAEYFTEPVRTNRVIKKIINGVT